MSIKESNSSVTKLDDDSKLEDEEWTTVDLRKQSSKGSDQKAVQTINNNEGKKDERVAEIKIFPQHVPTSQFIEDPIMEKSINTSKYTVPRRQQKE